MSWIGSDDIPLCDICNVMCPPGWPDGWTAPWPSSGCRWENDRAPADERNNFHLCRDCLQAMVLASVHGGVRTLALESRDRWQGRQYLLAEAEAIALDRVR